MTQEDINKDFAKMKKEDYKRDSENRLNSTQLQHITAKYSMDKKVEVQELKIIRNKELHEQIMEEIKELKEAGIKEFKR